MAPLMVRSARDRSEVRRFADLPVGLHRGEPGFVPVARRDELGRLRRLDGAPLFLAWRGNDVVGRVAAWVDDRIGGCFGWLDARHDSDSAGADVVDALLGAAAGALFDQGCPSMAGPLHWPLWDAPGLLVDGFGDRPVWGTAWNSPGLVGAVAGEAVCGLASWTTGPHATEQHYTTQRAVRLARAVQIADELSASSRTQLERDELAARVRTFADPALVCVHEGAAALAVPDVNEVLVRLGGDLGLRGVAGLLRAARHKGLRASRVVASGGLDASAEAAAIAVVARAETVVLGPWRVDDEQRNAVATHLGAREDRHWRVVRLPTKRDSAKDRKAPARP